MASQTDAANSPDDLMREMLNSIDAMIAYWDADQVCVFANAAYSQWFGKSPHDLIGTTLKNLLGPIYEKNRPFLVKAYAGEKQVFERAIPIPGGTGVRHSLATYVPHFVDGHVAGIIVHVADVSPLKRLQAKLDEARLRAENLAATDFLTGLPNRVEFDSVVTTVMARAARRRAGFALVTLDVDTFKEINDSFGHVEGDRFLVEIAKRLKAVARDEDVLMRLGGDEFVLVASNINSRGDCEALATRLVAAGHFSFECNGVNSFASVSAGIAMFPEHGTTAEALLRASDAALYQAKRRGRNGFALAA